MNKLEQTIQHFETLLYTGAGILLFAVFILLIGLIQWAIEGKESE